MISPRRWRCTRHDQPRNGRRYIATPRGGVRVKVFLHHGDYVHLRRSHSAERCGIASGRWWERNRPADIVGRCVSGGPATGGRGHCPPDRGQIPRRCASPIPCSAGGGKPCRPEAAIGATPLFVLGEGITRSRFRASRSICRMRCARAYRIPDLISTSIDHALGVLHSAAHEFLHLRYQCACRRD